jgi:hypothetical protein
MPGSNCETWKQTCDDFGSISIAGPIITLNGHITASEYVDILGNHVHPIVQMSPPPQSKMQFFKMTVHQYTQPEVFSLA